MSNTNYITNTSIYMDYQASTPLDSRVLEQMMPYLTKHFGNPHSAEHSYGWDANNAILKAKHQIASYIDAFENEIIFTSGATEANNLAIIGLGYASLEKHSKHTILISSIEHKCVLGAARFLEQFGFKIIKIPVQPNGIIDLQELEKLLQTNNVLLTSVMATNNEIGINQPIKTIGNLCKKYDCIFHVDAAQGAYTNINVIENNIDLMSLSAHKIYGPKGIGALYINQNISLFPKPIIYGGGQQEGFRSGTLPTFLCVGMGYAFYLMQQEKENEIKKISKLRDDLLKKIQSIRPDAIVNGTLKNRHPGNLNIKIPNKDLRQLIISLQPKIAFSTGSACTSGIPEPSHVLKAIGLSTEEAENSFRITVGRFTTPEDINQIIEILKEAL